MNHNLVSLLSSSDRKTYSRLYNRASNVKCSMLKKSVFAYFLTSYEELEWTHVTEDYASDNCNSKNSIDLY